MSVLARLAFEIAFWCSGAYEINVLCEEAHRYISSDNKQTFGPARQAIGRIAKEGRKYGASLGVVTQRPSELDPTVLSQCSTLFAMRLANELDKGIIRAAAGVSAEQHDRLPVLDRRSRGDRVRRGHRHADANEVRGHFGARRTISALMCQASATRIRSI